MNRIARAWENGKLTIQGAQIVAWLSDIVPAGAPKDDPDLPPEDPGKPPTTAREPVPTGSGGSR